MIVKDLNMNDQRINMSLIWGSLVIWLCPQLNDCDLFPLTYLF